MKRFCYACKEGTEYRLCSYSSGILYCVTSCDKFKECKSCTMLNTDECTYCHFNGDNDKLKFFALIQNIFCDICDEWQTEGYKRIDCRVCPYEEALKKILDIE